MLLKNLKVEIDLKQEFLVLDDLLNMGILGPVVVFCLFLFVFFFFFDVVLFSQV